MDLLDVARGRLSVRRMVVLVARLARMPGRSAVAAALWPAAAWSASDYLVADLIDRAEAANYLFVAANSETAPPIPEPYPRPGRGIEAAPDERDFASVAVVAAFMANLNHNN